jgi:polyhydroxyalkanoate synthase
MRERDAPRSLNANSYQPALMLTHEGWVIIAGIINPPGGKGAYWVNPSATPAGSAEQWREAAVRHDGSWWGDWDEWLAARSGDQVAPPRMGSAAHPALADAPGTFVLEK